MKKMTIDTPHEWELVQAGLKEFGLYDGEIDGIPGKVTHAALAIYMASDWRGQVSGG